MKEKLAAMGMPSMELWDGSVVPNFGKMGADSFMTGIQMVREGMTEHPDKIKNLMILWQPILMLNLRNYKV
jgi:hypothetical protein